MSKLPKIVYLGYRDLNLKRSPTMGNEEYGHFDSVKGIISISTGRHPHEEANTVLHEILHAMLNLSADPVTEKEEVEERLVTVLANQITELWRRNPDLIAYLDAKLGDTE